MTNRLCSKFYIFVIFLIIFKIGPVEAVSPQPQATAVPRNDNAVSKTSSVPNQASSQNKLNNQAVAQPSNSARTEATVEESSRNTTNQIENEKSKKLTKKKETAEEDKSDEPIEFNDQKGILAGLDYPELQVVPRASERLAFEAQDEKTRLISPYWPVQFSAISLIVAGVMSKGKFKNDSPDAGKNASSKSENAFASQLGIFTGGLWIGATYYMSHSLSYGEALQEIRKINGKDKKNTLLRERLAEEAIERPARVTYLVNTLSVWTTLFSSLYIVNNTTQISPSYAGIAAVMAFMPWLVDNRITRNWEKHQEYKRKIYAPLTMGTWEYDAPTREWRPLLTMNWVF